MGATRIENMLLQTSEKLLYIGNADRAACWRLKIVIPGERKVNGVFEAEPFLIVEEVAEGRVAESDGFVRAESLRAANISAWIFDSGIGAYL